MIEAIRKARVTEKHRVSGSRHNAFAWAYTEPALVEWLFAQKTVGRTWDPA